MGEPLSDSSPLIGAAASGKLRLVRLLIEGGARVNWRDPRGETALLAACKALGGEPDRPDAVKLLTYLLQNKADPNAQDRAGRTALMYACMGRAGAQVASTLLSAGADPSMEDHSGASALVYAINAQHQPTLKVLVEACRARGRDIIIIATETDVSGGPVTRRYLNVPPSPDASPVSCMSPSDVVLKTGSPGSPEGENIFSFRRTSSSSSGSRHASCHSPPPRERMLSEPRLAIHNLDRLNRAYEEGLRERSQRDESNTEDLGTEGEERTDEHGEEEESEVAQTTEDFLPGGSLFEGSLSQATPCTLISKRFVASGPSVSDKTKESSDDKLPLCPPPHSQLRRNTLPSVTVVPPGPFQLPSLVKQSGSQLQVAASNSGGTGFPPYPASSFSRASTRPALLPPLALSSSVSSLVASPETWRRKSLRRHSVQLQQLRGERSEQTNHFKFRE